MERRVNYLVIGGLFFAILVGLVVFIMWFGKIGVDEGKYRIYKIFTNYDISGIAPKTPIKYKGITIGSVKSIGFDKERLGIVQITLSIQKAIPIAKGSSVLIDSQGLAGLNYLSLRQNTSGEIIQDDKDAILTLEQSFLGKLSDKADSALAEIMGVLASADKLLSEQNIAHISHTLAELETFSKTLPALSNNLNRLVNKLNAQIDNGEYSVKTMLTPTLDQTQKTMQNLDITLQKTQTLINKFNENPYSTLFGEQK